MDNIKNFEIMSPAGSFESLMSAINAGADSIYFGVEQLNMRARSANNFKLTDLKEIVSRCKKVNVKTYLTLNTIMYDHDLPLMKRICDEAKKQGITAIIASDLSAITYASQTGIECHISTQMNISNIEEVKFFSKYADTIVLARELTLKQIKDIYEKINKENICGPKGNLIKIELFAHGALCVAVSGKCYMSLATQNASANRGACSQNCRRSYRVIDEESGEELVLDNKYIMSPKDLCTIGFIDKLIDAGVSVFKLEGRGRSADYVAIVTKVYKEAINSVLENSYTKDKIENWTKQLENVYNRGFWHGGYYLGKKLGEWSGAYGSLSKKENIYIGKITKYFVKSSIAECKFETGNLNLNDDILITGQTTGSLSFKIDSIQYFDNKIGTFKVPSRVRKNDKIYKVVDRENSNINKK